MRAPPPSKPGDEDAGSVSLVFFGYGSLVNPATLPPGARAVPASIKGWRRAWNHSGLSSFGRRCTLTVRPDPDASVLGVVITDSAVGGAALDARESQYRKVQLEPAAITWFGADPGWPAPYLYCGVDAHARWGDAEHPILLSYLDCVLAGFLSIFGEEGARTFMATTEGWHAPVFDDRDAPRYPRAVSLSPAERAFIDALLDEQGFCRLGDHADYRSSSVSLRN